MGLRGPVWGTAFVLYCAHKNSGALSTAKGHGVRSSRGGPTLTVPFLQSVSSRWLKAAGVHQGQNRGWTLPAAPWRGLPPWRLLRAAQGSRGGGAWRVAWAAGGALGPGDILARASYPLAGRHSPAPGALHAGVGPPCTPAHLRALLRLTPPRLGNKDASWCVSPGYWSGGRTGSCRVPRGSAASGSLRW